jgi:uncharacterized protein YbjT (DUF2867 family)
MTQNRQLQTVLVTGATGRQGGATVDALLEQGAGRWRIRALTRDPASRQAQALKAKGVELVQGDQDDISSLDRALRGAWGLFSVQLSQDFEAENRHACNLLDAARRAGVSFIVQTLSAGAGKADTGLDRFESKRAIAAYLRELGIPYAVLRPTGFMENFYADRAKIMQGTLTGAVAPDTKMYYIAVHDIGAFAAAAFAQPERFNRQEIDLAGDVLTGKEAAHVFTRVLGRPVQYVQTPRDVLERTLPPDRLAMNDWYDREGYGTDVQALKARYPDLPLMTLEQWLKTTGWGK